MSTTLQENIKYVYDHTRKYKICLRPYKKIKNMSTTLQENKKYVYNPTRNSAMEVFVKHYDNSGSLCGKIDLNVFLRPKF